MAKKQKFQEEKIENYYDLKVDKVNELVAALKDDADELPNNEVSMNINDCTGIYDPKNVKRNGKQKQFDPYSTDFLSKIPTWVKAIFIKWWFAGLVCYFVPMGLGYYVTDSLDRFVLTGFVLGIVVDLMVNPIFKFLESDRKEYDIYMMFPFKFKAFWTFFANMFYYLIVMIGVNGLYFGINEALRTGVNNSTYVAMEPLLFAVFALIIDMAFIGIKDLLVHLIRKSKKKENAANV